MANVISGGWSQWMGCGAILGRGAHKWLLAGEETDTTSGSPLSTTSSTFSRRGIDNTDSHVLLEHTILPAKVGFGTFSEAVWPDASCPVPGRHHSRQNCTGSTRVCPVMFAEQHGKQCHRSIDRTREDPDLCHDSPDLCTRVSRATRCVDDACRFHDFGAYKPGRVVHRHLRAPWHHARAGIQWTVGACRCQATARGGLAESQSTAHRRHCTNSVHTAQHATPHATNISRRHHNRHPW